MQLSLSRIAAAAVAATLLAGAAHAQDYPEGPITIVVPFAAGGPTDTVTRLIAEPMSETLGQPIVVQNVAGAGGTLASIQVASAPADGSVILMHHIGMSTAPALYPDLPYDPLEAFQTIGLVTSAPMTIIARKDFEPGTLEELVAYVTENADTVTYANAGLGGASHICGMLFMQATGTALTTVPYQGTGPAMSDLLGGQVDFMCDQSTNTTGQIQGGAVKAYAVSSPDRLDSLPDLPTTTEAGMPEMEMGVWHGLYAPAGTPEEVIAALSAALQAALGDETVIARFGELGTTLVSMEMATPEAHAAYLTEQIAFWRPIIEDAGVTAE